MPKAQLLASAKTSTKRGPIIAIGNDTTSPMENRCIEIFSPAKNEWQIFKANLLRRLICYGVDGYHCFLCVR